MLTKNNSHKTLLWLSILAGIVMVVAMVITLCVYQRADVSAAPTSEPVAATPSPQPTSDRKVVVYYFHGTYRCQTCMTIEQLTNFAVMNGFQDALEDGRLEFKAMNVETPENRHFIKDYQLFTKSVIVSEVRDGKEQRWKNLPNIWQLFMDQKAFVDYVQQEVSAYLTDQKESQKE